jgi:hypothetical protein
MAQYGFQFRDSGSPPPHCLALDEKASNIASEEPFVVDALLQTRTGEIWLRRFEHNNKSSSILSFLCLTPSLHNSNCSMPCKAIEKKHLMMLLQGRKILPSRPLAVWLLFATVRTNEGDPPRKG